MSQDTHNEEVPVPLPSSLPSPVADAVAPLSTPERGGANGVDNGASVARRVNARRRQGDSPTVRTARALAVLVLSDVLWELVRRYAELKCGR